MKGIKKENNNEKLSIINYSKNKNLIIENQ